MYRELRADPIVATLRVLTSRIGERFPGSGLSAVSGEVLDVAQAARETADSIRRPIYPLRAAVWAFALLVAGVLIAVAVNLRPDGEELTDLAFFLQVMEAGINDIILIGAALVFVLTVEVRIKRRRALSALHELRSLAHIVDMHQLTKDPERVLIPGEDTSSSPERSLSTFELSRYLDYCAELLSLLSKIAALYAQSFDDSVALAAVDEIEALTDGLSRKIWQKLMILNSGGAFEPLDPT